MQFQFLSRSRDRADGDRADVPADLDDAALVALVATDPCAFTTLYERYLGPVYGYCFTRLGNREQAEDATSEVFLKALAAIADFQGGVFAAWLFRIARNAVVDVYRRPRPTEPIEAAGEPLDQDPTPEDIAVARTERARLHAALDRLPEDQRTVVQLQLAGWSNQDIAQTLRKTPSAVKMLRFRALGRLRTILAVEMESNPESKMESAPKEASDG